MSRVLLVDDEALVLRFYGRLLEAGGHQVRTAATLSEALRMLDENAPEVLLMDLRMPSIEDGLRLIRAVPDGAGVKVIVMSGWVEDLRDHPEQQRVDVLLPKPVRAEVLLRSVARPLAAGA